MPPIPVFTRYTYCFGRPPWSPQPLRSRLHSLAAASVECAVSNIDPHDDRAELVRHFPGAR
ncbi:unnamed protein product [Periconia digitata]|uniref:Uncharacterized protein n=1 Tax=Periconia digitata TaxID=1303443 RepID=A0A9W4UT60_9PLEO|nr:unnamed protein product [Periconia digitata]